VEVSGWGVGRMGDGPGPGPAVPAGAGDGEATQSFAGGDPVTRSWLADPANPPPQVPTEAVPPRPVTEAVPHRVATEAVPLRPPAEVVRYGPGVPASPSAGQGGLTAERIWRTGHPPVAFRRPRRLRRLFGSALTVILLAASGMVLYLRFHHAPFHVTGVVISQQTRTRCGVDVTGRITTNGSAGTISYQWLFQPDQQPPQPLSQSVTAGQQAVYVTTALEGSGHGSATRTVTLQVLGPDPGSASTAVVVRC
jgi:hypothetical protein